jgi:hypothetical protein
MQTCLGCDRTLAVNILNPVLQTIVFYPWSVVMKIEHILFNYSTNQPYTGKINPRNKIQFDLIFVQFHTYNSFSLV